MDRLAEAVQGRRGEARLLKHQERWFRVGRFLYSRGIPGGTRYRGFEQQEQYDRLISWAAYAIMIPQANALNALTAFATRDAELARRQCRARAIWWALVTTGDVPWRVELRGVTAPGMGFYATFAS
jgi:hypothetical protein